jgi:hypothetical protein
LAPVSSGGLRREVSPLLRGAALPGASALLWAAAHRRTLAALDRAATAKTTSSGHGRRGHTTSELEKALVAARAELQRAVDAHAAEATAWDLTRQHLEAELQEALLEAQGKRSRLAAAHHALETATPQTDLRAVNE